MPPLALLALLLPAAPQDAPVAPPAAAEDSAPAAFLDGTGPGWEALTEADLVDVNGEPDTWTWQDGELHSTGKPVGVIRTREPLKNFEMSLQWRHLKAAGNSGTFVWVPEEKLTDLPPGRLPGGGIEVQILDHGYTEKYESGTGKPGDWFSTDGDVFPVGSSKMTPFPPLSPNGSRSFPSERRSKGVGEWNHYYVRAINGEVRLWVNGKEVSGGTNCQPAEGYLCFEAEGSPIEFREVKIRKLP
ncbi:3-keto-disaccharide hydrolase [Alienimonas californiensis]|uniref:3-keto-alpha-glucoside-1,2-lyase/3-keto-2-hydroxy-glucal hydratase domain-containing protein n=1 Tax=Alienimonas californiensis TaxID=2527989 RepID=A0A517PCC9_9PLAN|nr:DUF1080 domain-containing protein [Alienimonas californiensis]QDT17025.1 hypothetical protein CA12_31360 [Alienimonas californiensis]